MKQAVPISKETLAKLAKGPAKQFKVPTPSEEITALLAGYNSIRNAPVPNMGVVEFEVEPVFPKSGHEILLDKLNSIEARLDAIENHFNISK